MMNTLIASAFATSLSCNSLDIKEVKLNEPYEFSMWKIASCSYFSSLGDDVNISILNNTAMDKVENNRKGFFSFSQLNNGRVRGHWLSESKPYKKSFWLKVEVFKEVLFINKSVKAFQIIDARDVKYKVADVIKLGRYKVIGIDDLLSGYVAIKNLREGQMVTTEYVKKKPYIFRSDIVKVHVKNKNINIKTSGEALDIGWDIGDKIRVLIDDISKPIIGNVIGEGEINVN